MLVDIAEITVGERHRKSMGDLSGLMAMLKREMLPLKVDHDEVHGRRMQIKGTDIKVNMNIHLQVKCDRGGGEKPRGSGNLYLQSHESNPNGSH